MTNSLPLISAEEAAKRLNIAVSTLAKMRLSGKSPKYVKMGRRVAYRPEDIEEWIAAHSQTSTAESVPSTHHEVSEKPHPNFEVFSDAAYFDMWCLRPNQNKSFNESVHFQTRKEAVHASYAIANWMGLISQGEKQTKTDVFFGLSERTRNCIQNRLELPLKMITPQQVFSAWPFPNTPNLGRKSRKEIRHWLEFQGFEVESDEE